VLCTDVGLLVLGTASAEYLALEDLTWGRQWPCIMDVKMGTRSYEQDATADKIAYEKSKFPLQEEVGFRIQGIKVFDPKQRGYVEFDKHFGRGITSVADLAPAFRHFFPSEDGAKTVKLLEAVSACSS
jgi:1D-myo-inositol-tetrakisphosphate 5-kinase/inositol-polyphosphate multikinase